MSGGHLTKGERMRKIRRQVEKTQQEVAEVVGTSHDTISRFEKNKQDIRTDMLMTMLNYYNSLIIAEGGRPYTTDEILMDENFRLH